MPIINDELARNLYNGANPFLSAQLRHLDSNYPHTNIHVKLIDYLMLNYSPAFFLELGSFVGGSVLMIADSVKRYKLGTGIVCCDPFCGDVNMWDWEKDLPVCGKDGKPYKFIGLENGIPTIYNRFLANVFFNGHSDIVTPIQINSLTGLRLIERLFEQQRISKKPDIIYLDSAHELDETYLELEACWRVLPSKGILFGDDWGWDSVRSDVVKFSKSVSVDIGGMQEMHQVLNPSTVWENIFLFEGQWLLIKP